MLSIKEFRKEKGDDDALFTGIMEVRIIERMSFEESVIFFATFVYIPHYGNTSCGVFKQGVQN